MSRIFDWALARAQERSTYYGITSLLVGAGIAISPEFQAIIAEGGLALSGLLLIWTKEHTQPAKP